MFTRFFHESEKQFTYSEIKQLSIKYGHNILVGSDPGHGADFAEAVRACQAFGIARHAYLVGPGMMEWSAEERAEIERNAKSIGIDTNKKTWQNEWFKKGGWERKVYQWFIEYDKLGFYSVEIDNLDAVLDQDPKKYTDFIYRLEVFKQKNKLNLKLMIKNLSEQQLQALIDYNPDKDTLCEFGMFEEGSGNVDKQLKLSAKLGIQAVTPKNGLRDTRNYGTVRTGVPYNI